MPDLADAYRPIIEQRIALTSPDTQVALRRSLARALDGIEAMCPVALNMDRGYLRTAYGPLLGLANYRALALAATPYEYLICDGSDWALPEPDPELRHYSSAVLWLVITRGVREKNPEVIFNCLGARLPLETQTRMFEAAHSFRRQGLVPLLLVLCAADDERGGCGLATVICLPPSIEGQLASNG
jgi:hypothetical protein